MYNKATLTQRYQQRVARASVQETQTAVHRRSLVGVHKIHQRAARKTPNSKPSRSYHNAQAEHSMTQRPRHTSISNLLRIRARTHLRKIHVDVVDGEDSRHFLRDGSVELRCRRRCTGSRRRDALHHVISQAGRHCGKLLVALHGQRTSRSTCLSSQEHTPCANPQKCSPRVHLEFTRVYLLSFTSSSSFGSRPRAWTGYSPPPAKLFCCCWGSCLQ